MSTINQMPSCEMDPEFAVLVMNYFLMRLGGQVELPLIDLAHLSDDYCGCRIAYNKDLESVTFTLKTREAASPPPARGI